MSIVIACGQCSARFKLNDPALANRSFKCRKCGAAIRPASSAAVSKPADVAVSQSTVPVAPPRARTPDDDPFANVDWSTVGGGFEESDRPAASPSSYRPAVHSPMASTGRRRSTVVTRPAQATAAATSAALPGFLGLDQKSLGRAAWLLVMGVILVIGIFIPVVGLVAGSTVGIIGIGLIIVGALTMLSKPFQEDTMCGLMYLFVPMYPLYYVVTRWHEMKRGLLQVVLGYVLIFIGGLVVILSGGFSGAKMRNRSQIGFQTIHAPLEWVIAITS